MTRQTLGASFQPLQLKPHLQLQLLDLAMERSDDSSLLLQQKLLVLKLLLELGNKLRLVPEGLVFDVEVVIELGDGAVGEREKWRQRMVLNHRGDPLQDFFRRRPRRCIMDQAGAGDIGHVWEALTEVRGQSPLPGR